MHDRLEGMRTRTGTLLSKRPTICSECGNDGSRPCTIVPNTTSESPLCRPRTTAQQAWSRVFNVTLKVLAKDRRFAVAEVEKRLVSLRCEPPPRAALPANGNAVGA